jgi:hypothetical protein
LGRNRHLVGALSVSVLLNLELSNPMPCGFQRYGNTPSSRGYFVLISLMVKAFIKIFKEPKLPKV